MKIAIVDDEKYFVDEIISLLTTWNTKQLRLEIFPFLSGEALLEHYNTQHIDFDLIFMDITLGGIDGLDASRKLRARGYENEIVFTTNHQDFKYAQESLRVRALNYYAKPISLQDISVCMENLLHSKAFTYFYNSKRYSVLYKEILFFESKRNYIHLHLINPDSNLPMYKSNMDSLCQKLPNFFVRCHRSFIVNMHHLLKIEDKKLFLRGLYHNPITIGEIFLDDVLNYLTKM